MHQTPKQRRLTETQWAKYSVFSEISVGAGNAGALAAFRCFFGLKTSKSGVLGGFVGAAQRGKLRGVGHAADWTRRTIVTRNGLESAAEIHNRPDCTLNETKLRPYFNSRRGAIGSCSLLSGLQPSESKA